MVWSIFWETLRRERRATLFWALGLAFYGLITTVILPDAEGMKQLVSVLESLPGFIFQMLGVEDLTVLATPAGFIGVRYFTFAAVLLCVWGVMAGMNVTLNEETGGISNMLVSLPLPRWRLIVEKSLAYLPVAAVVAFGGFGGLFLGISINPNAQTDLAPLAVATLTLIPVMLVVFGVTVAIGAAVPRRGLVAGAAGGFVAASFLLKSVAGLAKSDIATLLAQFSIFQHADALAVIRDGYAPLTALILLAVTAALIALSIGLFQRRDLGG